MTSISTISAKRLADLNAQQDLDIIDVRMPSEYQTVHAVVARNVPLDTLDPKAIMKERKCRGIRQRPAARVPSETMKAPLQVAAKGN